MIGIATGGPHKGVLMDGAHIYAHACTWLFWDIWHWCKFLLFWPLSKLWLAYMSYDNRFTTYVLKQWKFHRRTAVSCIGISKSSVIMAFLDGFMKWTFSLSYCHLLSVHYYCYFTYLCLTLLVKSSGRRWWYRRDLEWITGLVCYLFIFSQSLLYCSLGSKMPHHLISGMCEWIKDFLWSLRSFWMVSFDDFNLFYSLPRDSLSFLWARLSEHCWCSPRGATTENGLLFNWSDPVEDCRPGLWTKILL